MPIVTIPGFGELDINLEDECYESEVSFDGRAIDLDLNLEDELEDYGVLDATGLFVDDLAGCDRRAREALEKDFHEGDEGSTALYLEHHVQELGEETLGFGPGDINGLLSALQLQRIGFYPEEPEQFAVFDYSLGESVTNYLLVVNFDAQGRVMDVVMES